VSDIIKTEKMILQKMGEFDNLYIFLERNEEFPYESAGRVQGEKEARTLDLKFKEMLESLNIPYISVLSSKHSIQKILDYII
jgi:hypothetical protein